MDENEKLIGFGRRMKLAREEKKMTQSELGAVIGATKSAICAYENGKTDPRMSILEPLASALRVSVTWLATGNNAVEIGNDPDKAQQIKDYVRFLETKDKKE